MEDRVILDVMDDHILAPGRYPENFVLISLLEVCQMGGGGWLILANIKDWQEAINKAKITNVLIKFKMKNICISVKRL